MPKFNLETWKNGKTYSIMRDEKGHFFKGIHRQEIRTTQDFFARHKISEQKKEFEKKREHMFRCSFAINNVPVHKKYYSFLLQAFSDTEGLLDHYYSELRRMCIKYANEYLGYTYNALQEWSGYNYYVGSTLPQIIALDLTVIDRWQFIVEEPNGKNLWREGELKKCVNF